MSSAVTERVIERQYVPQRTVYTTMPNQDGYYGDRYAAPTNQRNFPNINGHEYHPQKWDTYYDRDTTTWRPPMTGYHVRERPGFTRTLSDNVGGISSHRRGVTSTPAPPPPPPPPSSLSRVPGRFSRSPNYDYGYNVNRSTTANALPFATTSAAYAPVGYTATAVAPMATAPLAVVSSVTARPQAYYAPTTATTAAAAATTRASLRAPTVMPNQGNMMTSTGLDPYRYEGGYLGTRKAPLRDAFFFDESANIAMRPTAGGYHVHEVSPGVYEGGYARLKKGGLYKRPQHGRQQMVAAY